MFGTLGFTEVAVIFLLALVLFGPKKLPELGRTIGKAMTEFRRASNDLKATFDREMQTLERETKPVKAATETIAREIRDETYSYPPASVWTALEQGNETASDSTSVGASEVSGAESQGTSEEVATSTEPAEAGPEVATAEEPASAAPEGTVPRGAAPPSPPQDS